MGVVTASIQTLHEAIENYCGTFNGVKVAHCVLKKVTRRAAAAKLGDVNEYCRLLDRKLSMPSFGLSYLTGDSSEGANFMHAQVS